MTEEKLYDVVITDRNGRIVCMYARRYTSQRAKNALQKANEGINADNSGEYLPRLVESNLSATVGNIIKNKKQ